MPRQQRQQQQEEEEAGGRSLLAPRVGAVPVVPPGPPEKRAAPRMPISIGELLRMVNPRRRKPWTDLPKTTKQVTEKLAAVDVPNIDALRVVLMGIDGHDLGITLNQRLEQRRKKIFNAETIDLFIDALQIPRPGPPPSRNAEEKSKATPPASFELALVRATADLTAPSLPVIERPLEETWFSVFSRLQWYQPPTTTDGFEMLFARGDPHENSDPSSGAGAGAAAAAAGAGSGAGAEGDADRSEATKYNKKTILAYTPRRSSDRHQFCTLGQGSLCAWDQKRGEYARVKERSGQEGYFQSLVYIEDLRVYFISSMDMYVYVFSQGLELVNKIFAGERAITQIEYDRASRVLYTGSVDGLAAWKITFKKANSILGSVKGTYGLKMLHRFAQCDPWVTKMRLQPEDHHIYVLWDQRVEVYDTRDPAGLLWWSLVGSSSATRAGTGAAPSMAPTSPTAPTSPNSRTSRSPEKEPKIRETRRHREPISAALYYKRSQYWITSCHAGEIKVWTRFHSSPPGSANKLQSGRDWALLHRFDGHTQGVTSLAYLDTYGYIVSASLDGTIRCWDVETLTLVTVVTTPTGVSNMQLVCPGLRGYGGGGDGDGNAADGSADGSAARRPYLCVVDHTNGAVGVWRINTHAEFFDSCQDEVQTIEVHHPKSTTAATVEAKSPISGAVGARRRTTKKKRSSLFAFLEAEKAVILVTASRDIRLYNAHKMMKLECALEPGSLADAFLECAYSIPRKTIYGLMNSGDIRLIVSKKGQYFKPIGNWRDAFPIPGDVLTCLALLEVLPRLDRGDADVANLLHEHRDAAASMAAKATVKSGGFGRLRAAAAAAGEAAKYAQVVAAGGTRGFVSFLDAQDDGKLLSSFDAHHNTPVHGIYFSALTNILVTVDTRTIMKLWRMPSCSLTFAAPLGELPTAVAFSRIFPRMVIGHADGVVRMVHLNDGSPEQVDPVLTVSPHTSGILGLAFCDALHMYASSSADRSVHVRDFGNRLVHKLVFDRPARAITFLDDEGTLMLSQGKTVIQIPSGLVMPGHMKGGVKKFERGATFICKHVRGYFGRVRFAAYRADKERERAEAEARKELDQTFDTDNMGLHDEDDEEGYNHDGDDYFEYEYSEGEDGFGERDFDEAHSDATRSMSLSFRGGGMDSVEEEILTPGAMRRASTISHDNTTASPQRHRVGSIVSAITTTVVPSAARRGGGGEQYIRERAAPLVTSVDSRGQYGASKPGGGSHRWISGSKSSYVGDTVSQAPFSIDRLSLASVAHTEAPPLYMRRVRPNPPVAAAVPETKMPRVRGTPEVVDAAFKLAQAVSDTCIRDVFWHLYFSHQYGAREVDAIGAMEGDDEDEYSDLSRSTPVDRRPDTNGTDGGGMDPFSTGMRSTPSFGADGLYPAFISHVSVTSKDERAELLEDQFPEPPPGSSQRPSFDLSEKMEDSNGAHAALARAHESYESHVRQQELLRGKQLDILQALETASQQSFQKSLEEDDSAMQLEPRLRDMAMLPGAAEYDPYNQQFAGSNGNSTWRLSTPSSAMGQTPIPPAPHLVSRFPRRPSRQRKIRGILYKGDARWEVEQTHPESHLAALQARRPG